MLYFLRTEYVDLYAKLHSTLKNGFDTTHQMKQALNNWTWNGKPITWGCFKKLQPLILKTALIFGESIPALPTPLVAQSTFRFVSLLSRNTLMR